MPKKRPTTRNRAGRNLERIWDRERGSAASRGYGARHRHWRKLVLARDPLCVHCKERGRVEPATQADHITPLRQGGGWELENAAGLCASCHSKKTARETRDRSRGL